MVNVKIAGRNDFPCSAGWKVQDVIEAIRGGYGLRNGYLMVNNKAVLCTETITAGNEYSFVNFEPAEGVAPHEQAGQVELAPSDHEAAVGSKRKNMTDLEQQFSIAPSTFAIGVDSISAKASTSWVQLGPRFGIQMHRPEPGMFGIHCTLLSECFALFRDDYSGVAALDSGDFNAALTVCSEMSGFMKHTERVRVMNGILSDYLDVSVTMVPIGSSGITADGGITTKCGTSARNIMPSLLIEYKADMALGSCTPVEHNIGYYIQSFRHLAAFASSRSVCPSLLVSVVGPYMSVSFAAHGERVVIDPATPFLSLLVLPHDVDTMLQVARILKAIKNCVKRLAEHYEKLPAAALSADELEQLKFPYKRSFTELNSQVISDFQYIQQLGKKLVFEAVVTSAVAGSAVEVGAHILVKFTRSYCRKAHEVCMSLDPPAAPRLYAVNDMPGGWMCVVMEFIADAVHFTPGQGGGAAVLLNTAVQALHSHNIVHGDLRPQNILVKDDHVFLIDFDWSGTELQQRYPPFMNHLNVTWADDAGGLLPLKKSHDIHFMVSELMQVE